MAKIDLSSENIERIQQRRKRTMDYCRVSNDLLFKCADKGLSASATHVIIYLLLRSDYKTGVCRNIRRVDIQTDLSLNAKTVYRAFQELMAKRFIDVEDGVVTVLDTKFVNESVDRASYKSRLRDRRSDLSSNGKTSSIAGLIEV